MRGRLLIIGAVVAIVAAAAGIGVVVRAGGDRGSPDPAVSAYLQGWSRFDPARMTEVVDRPPPDFAEAVKNMKNDLRAVTAKFTVKPDGIRRHGNQADAGFDADIQLGGL